MFKTSNPKYRHFHVHYMEGAEYTGIYKMPVLVGTQSIPTEKICSFSERKSITRPEEYWLDFFIDDHQFNCIWNDLDRYIPQFSRFAGIIGPDYSMLPQLPDLMNAWNCFKNKIVCHYLMRAGISVIPVASWVNIESIDWSLDGLPRQSSIAVTNNGCMNNPDSFRIFIDGVHQLMLRLDPTHLIVCGSYMPELSVYGNRILYYRSFSQRIRRPYDGWTRSILA